MSSDYAAVSAELKRGTPSALICTTCPWHRPCVQPPSMTETEYRRKLEEATSNSKAQDGAGAMGTIVAAALFGPQVTSGAMCPVFALRLGGPDGREYADSIRSMMRATG